MAENTQERPDPRQRIIRLWEGADFPDGVTLVQVLVREDMPVGTGTATQRCYTLLVEDQAPDA